jgi:hypothetical protein
LRNRGGTTGAARDVSLLVPQVHNKAADLAPIAVESEGEPPLKDLAPGIFPLLVPSFDFLQIPADAPC